MILKHEIQKRTLYRQQAYKIGFEYKIKDKLRSFFSSSGPIKNSAFLCLLTTNKCLFQQTIGFKLKGAFSKNAIRTYQNFNRI